MLKREKNMKTKLIIFFSVIIVVFSIMVPFLIFGETEKTGTYFEIQDSEYLNITLESAEEIKVILESIPRMISLDVEADGDSADITELTVKELEPNKTYYKYQDSYKNEAVFISDENGTYSWTQDLTQPHHVWIQEEKGTTFVDKDIVLDGDIAGSVEIIADNITLDCNGHSITGEQTGYGIYLKTKTDVIIKNCVIKDFSYGINLYSRSTNNKIIGNNILDNYYGIFIEHSPENYFRDNSMANNNNNFGIRNGIWALGVSQFIQDIDISNTVNGKPIYYLVNEQDKVIDSAINAGFVGVVNSRNITVKDLTIEKNAQGVLFAYTTDSTIENVTALNNQYGLFLYSSSNNNITNNNISNNKEGIVLDHNSLNNNIINNNASDNTWVGILLGDFSNNNIISENNVLNNGEGIILSCGWCWTSNNTITANNVSNNFDSGIVLGSSTNNNITANNVSNNGFKGIYLSSDSSNNNITENNVLSNGYSGIHVSGSNAYTYGWGDHSSKNNKIIGNNISNNGYGIYLESYAPENYFRDNSLEGNKYSFKIDGYKWGYRGGYYNSRHYIQDIDTSNTINGKPIYYLVNEQDKVIDANSNASFVGVINSKNIIIKDLILENNFEGILLFNTSESTIENVNVSKNNVGIALHLSLNNRIIRNNVVGNERGIYLSQSSNNDLIENIIFNSENMGIYLWRSSNNNLIDNNILNNRHYGIYFTGEWFEGSNNNKIYHNNFINNYTQQSYVYRGIGNLFNNGYPSGGNYWSDYSGIDEKSGPNQDQPGSDGIGDTSYIFPDGQDNYPFIIENGWEVPPPEEPELPEFNVAVILAETNDVPRQSSSITEQPCKLLPEKTYPQGRDKEYYQDLAYCVADYHKENSFGTVNLNFTIYDNDGEWFKTNKNEQDYLNKEDEFVEDAVNLATNAGIDLSGYDMVAALHSGVAAKTIEDRGKKLNTMTWGLISQPLGYPPYKIILAEDDMIGAWSHEIGHIIGVFITPENTIIPDLSRYDILMGFVEKWDLMARGSWNGGLLNTNGTNPPYMSSYTKEFLKWLNYDIHPESAYGEYWINSLETSDYGDKVFRYNLSDDTNDESPKYYILEARNRALKTWDSSLPGLPIVGDKNLVLYYVDTKGLPEYGYVQESTDEYEKGMMWNQYRVVTIPGNNPKNPEINDGVLNPLVNETYRDLDNLVKFSAITDRIVDDKYEIQARIEEITYDSFSDNFWGVVLRPKSTLKKWVGGIFNPNSIRISEPYETNNSFSEIQLATRYFNPEIVRAQVGMPLKISTTEKATGVIKLLSWLSIRLLILFIPLSLLLLGLDKKVISRCQSKKAKKALKIIFRIVWVITLILFILFIISLILVPILEKIEPPFFPSKPGEIWNPLLYSIFPDLDLHLYCEDGRHVGINYGTGEYEVQVPGAIISGDNQDAPEWIFISPEITGCRFVVSSYDNQKFLEENPEIAQEIGDTSDSYEVYARYIDLEAGIYTSTVVSQKIEPGIGLEHEIKGASDIIIEPGISTQITFEDPKRGTKLIINTTEKTFQFIAPDKEFLIKKADWMKIIELSQQPGALKYNSQQRTWGIDNSKLNSDLLINSELKNLQFKEKPREIILIKHRDEEIVLFAVALTGEIDFSLTNARDLETKKHYLLIDKIGRE